MPITFVKREVNLLRALPTSPREMRSLPDLVQATGLTLDQVVEMLSRLRKHHTIYETDSGMFYRQRIPEIDGSRNIEIREDLS